MAKTTMTHVFEIEIEPFKPKCTVVVTVALERAAHLPNHENFGHCMDNAVKILDESLKNVYKEPKPKPPMEEREPHVKEVVGSGLLGLARPTIPQN